MRIVFQTVSFFILISISYLQGFGTSYQHRHLSEKWYYNYPLSPVILKINSSSSLTITNVSDRHILQYKFGCVKQVESKLIIKHKTPAMDIDLRADEVYLEDSSHSKNIHLKRCLKSGGKLAIIEVHFADDSEWKAN
ncbi:MAG: hypothetical protein AB1489_42825 [Acidobacteriota bacterium]